jgi:hypothetical protein
MEAKRGRGAFKGNARDTVYLVSFKKPNGSHYSDPTHTNEHVYSILFVGAVKPAMLDSALVTVSLTTHGSLW